MASKIWQSPICHQSIATKYGKQNMAKSNMPAIKHIILAYTIIQMLCNYKLGKLFILRNYSHHYSTINNIKLDYPNIQLWDTTYSRR
jgi:hypothetical protein